MSTATTVMVGRQKVNLSNLDKVLYPETGFTKGDVLHYYMKLASVIVPHLAGRPLTLKRYPNGVEEPFFYEKRCPTYKPQWIHTAHVASSRDKAGVTYCVVDNPASLMWIANLASLELHALLSRGENPDRPTYMVFDLDPGAPATILDCARIAIRLRDLLEHLGLKSFVKTSGGKGIHMWVPLNTPVTFDETKAASMAIAQALEKQDPEGVVSNMSKKLRPGKVFIDWSQNDRHKTTAVAYSLRAGAAPTVSTPLKWPEVEGAIRKGDAKRLRFEAGVVIERVAKEGDLFAPVLKMKQKLPGG
jgi:bifunctional non-homologous end joining protein LigD